MKTHLLTVFFLIINVSSRMGNPWSSLYTNFCRTAPFVSTNRMSSFVPGPIEGGGGGVIKETRRYYMAFWEGDGELAAAFLHFVLPRSDGQFLLRTPSIGMILSTSGIIIYVGSQCIHFKLTVEVLDENKTRSLWILVSVCSASNPHVSIFNFFLFFKNKFWMNKEKFTRASFEPATSKLRYNLGRGSKGMHHKGLRLFFSINIM